MSPPWRCSRQRITNSLLEAETRGNERSLLHQGLFS